MRNIGRGSRETQSLAFYTKYFDVGNMAEATLKGKSIRTTNSPTNRLLLSCSYTNVCHACRNRSASILSVACVKYVGILANT